MAGRQPKRRKTLQTLFCFWDFRCLAFAALLMDMRYALAVLCALAVVSAQVLYGGAMRPVFALPALILVGLAGALGLAALVWRNVPAPSAVCVASVVALAGWLIWRCVHSPDVWLAQTYLRLILGCLVVYLLFAAVLTNPFHRLTFVGILLVVAAAEALTAALQFAQPTTGPVFPWLSEQLRLWYGVSDKAFLRGHGTFLNGNHLAWALNAAGLMALALICWGRWGLKSKLVCLWGSLVILTGAILTLSRGGALGLGAGLAAFLALSAVALSVGARDRRWVAVLAVSGGILAVATVVFLVFQNSFQVQNRFAVLLDDTYRTTVAEAVLRQAQLDPIHGAGAGMFLYFGRQYRELRGGNDDIYAHNDWAQILADFGAPALALVLLVVGVHAVTGFRSFRDVLRRRMSTHARPQSHVAALGLGAMCCLAAFSVHSVFDFNMQIPANALLASALLGMLANSGLAPDRGTTRAGALLRRTVCLGAGAGGIWLSVLSWKAATQDVAWLLAENALLTDRPNEAISWAQSGLQNGRHSRLVQTLGDTYLQAAFLARNRTGRQYWSQRALGPLRESVELVPWDAWRHLRVAEAATLAGSDDEAKKAVFSAIALDPLSGRGYELYAEALERDGRLVEAIRVYDVARRLPENTHSSKSFGALSQRLQLLTKPSTP